MGGRGYLTAHENAKIISELAKCETTLEIYKIIGRYYGTVKKFVAATDAVRSRAGRGSQGLFPSEPNLVWSEKLQLIPLLLVMEFSDEWAGENTGKKFPLSYSKNCRSTALALLKTLYGNSFVESSEIYW